jgi:hypothetical protein
MSHGGSRNGLGAESVKADSIRETRDYEPIVLHFSGHSAESGNLCVENDIGNGDFITPAGLTGQFGQHRSTLKCVVVSACYSRRLAEALATKIDYVIGMRGEIGDEVAIVFSEGPRTPDAVDLPEPVMLTELDRPDGTWTVQGDRRPAGQ